MLYKDLLSDFQRGLHPSKCYKRINYYGDSDEAKINQGNKVELGIELFNAENIKCLKARWLKVGPMEVLWLLNVKKLKSPKFGCGAESQYYCGCFKIN